MSAPVAFISGAVATTHGVWYDMTLWNQVSFDIRLGGGTSTVQIRFSNAATKPANSADEIQAGTDITADGIYTLIGPYRWVKVMISAWTSGTVNVNGMGTA